MSVLVDTSVWALALRREIRPESKVIEALSKMIFDHQVKMIGPVRQEILSGVRRTSQFDRLKSYLDAFPDIEITTDDYVSAARFFNLCRSKGVQGSNTDFLICAVAYRNEFSIYTTDKDFDLFALHLPIALYA